MIVFQFTRTLGLAVLVVLNLRQQYLLGTSSERVRGLFAIFVRATIVACTITALLMRMTPSVLIIIYLLGYGHVGAYISLIAFTGMSNFFLFQFIFTVVYIKPFHIKLTLFFQRLFKNKIFAYKQQPIVATIC
uniref:G_PROTEIN_RECEP_F1_2 domain-containing protein n=1 Tax=Panagrellus redivivus TaxID=6233 RepID=A0A7E4VR51_PANRE